MKRIMTAIASLALLACLASCQKEGTGKENEKETTKVEIGQLNLTASFFKTRVSYAETEENNLKPSWEEGDKIFCTADGTTFYPLTVGTVNSDGSANISGQGPANGSVALLYKNGLAETPSISLSISYAGQNGDKTMPNVLFASGTITNGTGKFEFKSAGSVVGVSYAKSLANKTIKSITISGTNLSAANVTYASNAFTLTATPNDSDAITTANLTSKNITVKSNGEFIAPVFIAVPAGATISKVTVTSTDDVTDTKNLSSPKAVGANQYLYVKAPAAPEAPEGAINGLFSVRDDLQVYFSQGNLKYVDGTTNGTWSFETKQYEFSTYPGNNNTPENTYGLFGWGNAPISGPVNNSTNIFDYSWPQVGQSDPWGSKIDDKGTWRTLSKAEWAYLLGMVDNGNGSYVQNESSGVRHRKFGLGTVCDKIGMIILPDDWTLPSGLSAFVPTILNNKCKPTENDPFNKNKYNAEQWSAMESAGAVFLPAAGYRLGSDVNSVGSDGRYWSSTALVEYNSVYYLIFDIDLVGPSNSNSYVGFSVRLVSDCNE